MISSYTMPALASCITCGSACTQDPNYCLPKCYGRGGQTTPHFFCQNCWEHTFSRVNCQHAECVGCQTNAAHATHAAHAQVHPEPQRDIEQGYDVNMM